MDSRSGNRGITIDNRLTAAAVTAAAVAADILRGGQGAVPDLARLPLRQCSLYIIAQVDLAAAVYEAPMPAGIKLKRFVADRSHETTTPVCMSLCGCPNACTCTSIACENMLMVVAELREGVRGYQ